MIHYLHHHAWIVFAVAWGIEIGVSIYWKRRCQRAEKVLSRFIAPIVSRRKKARS